MRALPALLGLLLCTSALASDQELRARLDELRTDNRIAGLYLATISGDEVETWVIGVTDHKSGTPLTDQHYVRIGSVSKLFLGLATLRLHEQGDLDPARPLAEYVENLPYTNPFAENHSVTLAQLLEHTAGLGDMTRPEWEQKEALSLEEAFALDPSSRELKWPPGLHSSYSNSGAGIASHIFRQVTGRKLEPLMQDLVFDYIGLETATYKLNRKVRKWLVTGYDTDGLSEIPYWHTLYPAFGGINIRAAELPRLVRLFLNEGTLDGEQLFTPEQIARMSRPTTTIAARSGLTYGYGLGLYQYTRNGFPMIGHGGDADGYLAYLSFSPTINKGYVLVINAFNYSAMRRIRNVVEHHLTKNEKIPQPPATYKLSPEETQAIVGYYEEVTYRFRRQGPIRVLVRDDGLFTQQGSKVLPLIPVSARHFRRPDEPVATIAIVEEAGRTWFQSDDGNFARRSSR